MFKMREFVNKKKLAGSSIILAGMSAFKISLAGASTQKISLAGTSGRIGRQ